MYSAHNGGLQNIVGYYFRFLDVTLAPVVCTSITLCYYSSWKVITLIGRIDYSDLCIKYVYCAPKITRRFWLRKLTIGESLRGRTRRFKLMWNRWTPSETASYIHEEKITGRPTVSNPFPLSYFLVLCWCIPQLMNNIKTYCSYCFSYGLISSCMQFNLAPTKSTYNFILFIYFILFAEDKPGLSVWYMPEFSRITTDFRGI